MFRLYFFFFYNFFKTIPVCFLDAKYMLVCNLCETRNSIFKFFVIFCRAIQILHSNEPSSVACLSLLILWTSSYCKIRISLKILSIFLALYMMKWLSFPVCLTIQWDQNLQRVFLYFLFQDILVYVPFQHFLMHLVTP